MTSQASLTGTSLVHVAAGGRADHVVKGPAVRRELGDVQDLLHVVVGDDALGDHAVGVALQDAADAVRDGREVAPGDQGAEDGDGVGGEPQDQFLVVGQAVSSGCRTGKGFV
ncbi:MAG: hypothetical protein Q4Q62_01675 [Thermoplasmata archaeon]|nr:hypothetical protein [Thermoplasmata archaeon]